MGWTKLQLVESAFEEVGLASYNFDLQPEQKQSAMRRMDAMVAEWIERGLQLGYNLTGNLNSDSGLAMSANSAVYLQLAIRIAPSMGKTVPPETKTAASAAMDSLFIAAAQPIERQPPSDLPRGEGQKPWRTVYYPFMPPPDTSPLRTPMDDVIDIQKD